MLIRLRFWLILFLNTILIFLSLLVAWLLRFEFMLPQLGVLFSALPILILVRLAALARFSLLHGYWRYTGISDIADILKAVALGSTAFLIIERYLLGFRAFPKSIYVLEALFTVAALCSVRLFSRILVHTISANSRSRPRRTVIIVGAGDAGATLLKGLLQSGYSVAGIVDDDPYKLGMSIHGVHVIGRIHDLPALVSSQKINEVLIAIPSATGRQMRRIINLCEASRVRFRTIPGMADLINGTVTVEQLREVKIEDLLGREPVSLDVKPVREQIENQAVMVTGAAGSIGSELCSQLLAYKPRKLICIDQDESGLFFLEQNLARHDEARRAEYHVADIADRERLRCIMFGRGVDIIFHAAAYKHVPMMEANVAEAVRNNIFGLVALLDVAEQCACKSLLMISSDKAVNPTNVMGCTKRICELIVAARNSPGMRRVSVRFGNVLGSQGSVVPVLQEQIRKSQVVTVTHPDITRFFMTIPEAVSLVLQAFTIGRDGEILVLEMGEPLRITDLARTLIRLCGKREDDVDIVFTGLRPGEKLHEELFYDNEEPLPTSCDKVRRTLGQHPGWPLLEMQLSELHTFLYSGKDILIRAKLKQIVPEYVYADQIIPISAHIPAFFPVPGPETMSASSGAND